MIFHVFEQELDEEGNVVAEDFQLATEAFFRGELDLIDLFGPDLAQAIETEGIATIPARGGVWEHLAFQFGSGRLETNPDSLTHELDFRRAVAHAIDRQRLVSGPLGGVGRAIASYLDAYGMNLASNAWAQYGYDPELARDLIADICVRLQRDCEAEPPRLHYTVSARSPRPEVAA